MLKITELDFSNATVLVLGDIMLDKYWFGATKRISPEAPVPVVHIKREEYRPGGAGNVALNIASLGAKVQLLGITGDDNEAKNLEQQLKLKNIYCNFIKSKTHPTITKLRVLSENQQLIRLDQEQHFADDPRAQQQLENCAVAAIPQAQAVIISDYNKGSVKNISKIIAMAKEHNIITLVDPKHHDVAYYSGVSIMTPNFKEFQAMVGECVDEQTIVTKAQQLIERYDIANLVVTRGADGMSIITSSGIVEHIATDAKEVFDVTGAGDTVIAVIGLCLANGLGLVTAAKIANMAASIVVGKVGTATATMPELIAKFTSDNQCESGTIATNEQLLQLVATAKARGEKIVFTNGCFDILHAGHVGYLEQARALGDRLIVAVNSDASVAKLKGPERPINKLADRMAVLAGLKSVDWLLSFDSDTPEELINNISPDFLVKGGDYNDIHKIPGSKHVLAAGGAVKLLDLLQGKSTSNTIGKILQQ